MGISRAALRREVEAELLAEGWQRPQPEEPPKKSVIQWSMRYKTGGGTYDFAAIRASDGYWYKTGSGGGPLPWGTLLQWIREKAVLPVTLMYLEADDIQQVT